MHVTKTTHRRTVGTLLGIIVGLVVTVLVLILDNGAPQSSPVPFGTTTPTYLEDEEAVVIETATSSEVFPLTRPAFEYIEITESCDYRYEGVCVIVRSGPGTDYEAIARLRTGVVLKVDGLVNRDGIDWYKVTFDEWLRYPERVKSDWYVAASLVSVLYDEGDKTIWDDSYSATSTHKRIVVNRARQTLTAYEGETVLLATAISTGLALTPTPKGTFTIFKKTPSRYMQGPLPGLPSDQHYDLPGVPWNLYFTHDGAVIHGTYWHDSFGFPYSHGCVNLRPSEAKTLYTWADLGTKVIIE